MSPFPARASALARDVDALYLFLVVVSAAMSLLIFALVVSFAFKYRRRAADEPAPRAIHGSIPLEIAWSVIPFGFMLIMFFWGSKLYFEEYGPAPQNAINVYVTGKQWMWKIQYLEGQREINELHVPTGRPVKLTMASEDTIHSFFVPAFRIKHDVVPGRLSTFWFEATKPGRYHLFCAEYCGTSHSKMGGWVTVMEPVAYENWLSGGAPGVSMAQQGQKLFEQFGCLACHLMDTKGRCPNLRNVYGHAVSLEGGGTVVADDAYLRESIFHPNDKLVAGYKRDVMPSYQGQITEDQFMQLMVYIKSLSDSPPERSAR